MLVFFLVLSTNVVADQSVIIQRDKPWWLTGGYNSQMTNSVSESPEVHTGSPLNGNQTNPTNDSLDKPQQSTSLPERPWWLTGVINSQMIKPNKERPENESILPGGQTSNTQCLINTPQQSESTRPERPRINSQMTYRHLGQLYDRSESPITGDPFPGLYYTNVKHPSELTYVNKQCWIGGETNTQATNPSPDIQSVFSNVGNPLMQSQVLFDKPQQSTSHLSVGSMQVTGGMASQMAIPIPGYPGVQYGSSIGGDQSIPLQGPVNGPLPPVLAPMEKPCWVALGVNSPIPFPTPVYPGDQCESNYVMNPLMPSQVFFDKPPNPVFPPPEKPSWSTEETNSQTIFPKPECPDAQSVSHIVGSPLAQPQVFFDKPPNPVFPPPEKPSWSTVESNSQTTFPTHECPNTQSISHIVGSPLAQSQVFIDKPQQPECPTQQQPLWINGGMNSQATFPILKQPDVQSGCNIVSNPLTQQSQVLFDKLPQPAFPLPEKPLSSSEGFNTQTMFLTPERPDIQSASNNNGDSLTQNQGLLELPQQPASSPPEGPWSVIEGIYSQTINPEGRPGDQSVSTPVGGQTTPFQSSFGMQQLPASGLVDIPWWAPGEETNAQMTTPTSGRPDKLITSTPVGDQMILPPGSFFQQQHSTPTTSEGPSSFRERINFQMADTIPRFLDVQIRGQTFWKPTTQPQVLHQPIYSTSTFTFPKLKPPFNTYRHK